jgi:site-specific DNA recombinase
MELTNENDLSDIQTADELKAALIAALSPELAELDIKTLKFALYCRKSTSGDEKQERSIEDQKADCLDAAARLGINVVEVIEERESAKAPHIRPRFRYMLDGLKKGCINGVLSYHPDRLSRNSLDSVELIWMLEEGVIRSFQFATFSFENSPMGKMLLGMSFVLSKQYTDHLREVVMRGQRRSILDGKYIHTPKHGYYKDITQRLRPDDQNWNFIKEAFVMRMTGKSLQAISDHLNHKGYTRAPAIGKERIKKYTIDTNRVSEFLRDPIYCGVLVFGETIVNLMEIYDFVPMITVEKFCALNKISNLSKNLRSVQKVFETGKKKADLLRGMVICTGCNHSMNSGISSKTTRQQEKEYRYYYRFGTEGCPLKNKSLRASIVFQYVYDFLERIDLTSQLFYRHTVEELGIIVEKRNTELRTDKRSFQAQITEKQKSYERTKEILLTGDKNLAKHFKGDLEVIEKDIAHLEEKAKDTEEQISNVKASIPSYEKYLELYKDVALKAKSTNDMLVKDQIIRKFFLNLYAEGIQTGERSDGKPVIEWRITDYKLTTLYEKLLESQLLVTGRSAGT